MFLSYKRGARIWDRTTQDVNELCTLVDMRRTWISYTVSILSLAMLITLVLPKNLGPAPCHALQSWAAENLSLLTGLRSSEEPDIRGNGDEFSLYSFGIQESADLGGPLFQDETILLEVLGHGGIYLKGSVMDLYTGKSWANTGTFNEIESFPPRLIRCLIH